MSARPFASLLIANRGEIACRIARTAQRLGIRTVAVYSEADRDALHVAMADEAVCIGPAPATESYLHIGKIIAAAQASGAEAIHPGYGFLSENADFAAACEKANIVFVGPSEASIRAMASKSAARKLMEQAGVPIVPGYHGDAQDDATLAAAAGKVGFPVLVKPVAGGGGKGMRVVTRGSELGEALAAARREAVRSFGDDHLIIEKYVARGRHIEVQVFGDTHGNIVSLFERDCTLQRRHQKVIEEAPAAVLSDERRKALCATARLAVRAIDYVGAGTVEFITDDENYYFLEVNTRLQVEHAVTEMITGLDLVEWQLRVAGGREVAARAGADRLPRACDRSANLRRGSGARSLAVVRAGSSGSTQRRARRMRVNSGVQTGTEVSAFYDPMLAKIIVSGTGIAPPPCAACARTPFVRPRVVGLSTNLEFLARVVDHDAFASGAVPTAFVAGRAAELLAPAPPPDDEALADRRLVAALSAAAGSPGGGSRRRRSTLALASRRRLAAATTSGARRCACAPPARWSRSTHRPSVRAGGCGSTGAS